MLPYAQLIPISKTADTPVYLQITNAIIQSIQKGILKPGVKLPGSRRLARDLQLHRQTVVRAIEELSAQGWVDIQASRGAFIPKELPKVRLRPLTTAASPHSIEPATTTGFTYNHYPQVKKPVVIKQALAFNDGSPDTRLAPVQELATAYARNLRNNRDKMWLGYGDCRGSEALRQSISANFNQSRGLHTVPDNIMITRGSLMGIYLTAQALLQAGDRIVIGQTNYFTANMQFQQLGAQLERIGVDRQGLCVEEIDALCQQAPIKAVYVTSHHHHPTTVALAPERRLRLLELARHYGFAIIEDDYDYDFHYGNSPLLPLASADYSGQVVYIGSFSKSTAPAFRVGYIVAPTTFIDELICLRRLVDRQGDIVLERTVADLINQGIHRRYLKKAIRHYRERRDCFAELLRKELGDRVQFEVPEGGMAIWVRFDPAIDLHTTSRKAAAAGLYLSDGSSYNPPGQQLNASRLGFASMNLEEIAQAVAILRQSISTY
ncbi:MAG: PLP-dependent aminotransferase family protein [Bacteroidota bacterium]